jgi:putative transposase
MWLDFSMKELYVSSTGDSAFYPRFYRKSLDKLAKEQRKLSRRQKGDKNKEKQKRKVAILHEHIANQRKDFLHKQSRRIANAYDAVCIEDLNMKAMSQALNFGKSDSDNSWGMFVNILSYKLSEYGKQLVKIDKWYPSSKICSSCGRIKTELPLSERTYRCECGFERDRDINRRNKYPR